MTKNILEKRKGVGPYTMHGPFFHSISYNTNGPISFMGFFIFFFSDIYKKSEV